MCQSACERGGWPSLTSELSWKPVDCDWLLVDSGAPFSAISNEAASHYRGTSPFPAHPENFLVQMQAVFLWSRSQLLKLSFGHGINTIIVKSRSKCIFIAWLMDHVVNNSHTELGFDTFSWLEASGFKALFLELFSDSFQLMIQHVFLRIARGCKLWFWCWPKFYWRSRSSIKWQCNRFFLAYNRNRGHGVTESSQVFPICRPNDFDVKNPQKKSDVAPIDPVAEISNVDPSMSTRYSSERFGSVDWKSRNMSCMVIFHFTQIYPFHWHCTICWFGRIKKVSSPLGYGVWPFGPTFK